MENKTNNNDTPVTDLNEHNSENNVTNPESDNSSSGDESRQSTHHHHHHHSRGHSRGHHHRSGRHHRSSHSKKKKVQIKTKFMWGITISLMVLLVVLLIIYETTDIHKPNDFYQSEEAASSALKIEVINSKGVLIKDAVNKYCLTDLTNPYNANVVPSSFSNGDGRLDEQVPVALKLSVTTMHALAYKIELSKNYDLSNPQIFYIDEPSAVCEFEHLYSNTKYFYRVTVYTNKGVVSKTGSFQTADTPRILSIEGLYNVRDIGNWRTDSGKSIKQGLLIRGTEMDGAVASEYHLTNAGLKDMLDVLGIKTDMDLRPQTPATKDALGPQVQHKYYTMTAYEGIFTDEGKEKVRMVFADLANPDNYPIYLHCTYGCDRTGTVCYLLEALLGVSRGDCLKEYGLSDLDIAKIQVVENGLKAYEGDTLKEQTEAYLLSCGLSEYQIESIRSIFLGD